MNPVAQELYQRIRREGAIDGRLIKVDRFLNHMVDPALIDRLGAELYRRFTDRKIDKIITAESSGIMIAQAIARQCGAPFIYAKKKRPITKEESTTLYVSREVLRPRERLLFADDFYAAGATYRAIEQIVAQAGATLVGTAVIINKSERRDIEAILTMDDLT